MSRYIFDWSQKFRRKAGEQCEITVYKVITSPFKSLIRGRKLNARGQFLQRLYPPERVLNRYTLEVSSFIQQAARTRRAIFRLRSRLICYLTSFKDSLHERTLKSVQRNADNPAYLMLACKALAIRTPVLAVNYTRLGRSSTHVHFRCKNHLCVEEFWVYVVVSVVCYRGYLLEDVSSERNFWDSWECEVTCQKHSVRLCLESKTILK